MALRELLPGWGCPVNGEDSAGKSEGQEPFGEHSLLQLKLWVSQVVGEGRRATMCWAWSIGKIKVSVQERNKSGKLEGQSSRIMKYRQAESKEIAASRSWEQRERLETGRQWDEKGQKCGAQGSSAPDWINVVGYMGNKLVPGSIHSQAFSWRPKN